VAEPSPSWARRRRWRRALTRRRCSGSLHWRAWWRACPLFVPLAEDGWTDGEVPRLVAEKYLLELRRIGVDTAVLGCTHYPLLARTIADVLGPRVAIVDSADATAEAVASLMASREMLRPPGAAPRHRTLCTDVPDRFRAVAERFLGRPVGMVELVDLQP